MNVNKSGLILVPISNYGIVVLALLERPPSFVYSHKKSSDLRQSFVNWDCRLHFVAPTSLNGVLIQSFSTNCFAFRWVFLRSSTQSSKLVSRPRIKKAPTCVEAL